MQSQRKPALERLLLALFVASGFAGLIYQAIWSHYLGLSLGHAAYAQTLVLAIFMGGMALGAWLISRFGVHWRRLIFAYAVVEVLIGIGGIAFHPIFEAYTSLSQNTVYPSLGGDFAVRAWQWGSAALLIAPQSILLGMTFPLMSGGYLRVAPRADGEILGGLYFTNSIGAAFGALFSTFVLLPAVGMPGAVATAGVVNIVVGLFAWLVSRRADVDAPAPAATPAETAGSKPADRGFFSMMLVAALITGGSSFVYEIGWVRMLNQALGTTVHSFELMLSAFILGLAFGGWWIRSRSSRITDAVSYAGYAQIWMGIAALLSILVFASSFSWVGGLMSITPRTDSGYFWFSLASGGISLLVMFPAAFFAGMTLPLFTMAMLRRGGGETSIGRIYAANTLGAILGVMLAVHVLIPLLGLRLAVSVAALADIVLGVVLIRRFANEVRPKLYIGALAASLVVIAASAVLGRLDPRQLASGVFRHGNSSLQSNTSVVYLKDGKTATVAFYLTGSQGTIATNGKPDASIQMIPEALPSDDEITMVMAAALPLAAHPAPETVAVIGWGSGLTTHTLLGSDRLTGVDTIEIEKAMYDGAMQYGKRVARGYTDPRSHLRIDDARTFFSTGKRQYDVIISEPSNPWVTGVAGLFTQQFYRFMREHLKERGLVVQWVQSYELSDELLATILSALIAEFPYVEVYLTNSADLLFLSSETPIPPLDLARLDNPELRKELKRVGLGGTGDLSVRKLANRDGLQALVTLFGAAPHSDYFPVVSLNAPRARFRNDKVNSLNNLSAVGMPLMEITAGRKPVAIAENVMLEDISFSALDHWNARDVRDGVLGASMEALARRIPKITEQIGTLRALSSTRVADARVGDWLEVAAIAADFTMGYLPAEDLAGVWIDPTWIVTTDQPEPVQAMLAAYDAAARRDGAAMRDAGLRGLGLLDAGAPNISREHLLVIAMLGHILTGDTPAAVALAQQQGAAIPPTNQAYGYARMYLLAWADSQQAANGG
jgi:spermidine synthase